MRVCQNVRLSVLAILSSAGADDIRSVCASKKVHADKASHRHTEWLNTGFVLLRRQQCGTSHSLSERRKIGQTPQQSLYVFMQNPKRPTRRGRFQKNLIFCGICLCYKWQLDNSSRGRFEPVLHLSLNEILHATNSCDS